MYTVFCVDSASSGRCRSRSRSRSRSPRSAALGFTSAYKHPSTAGRLPPHKSHTVPSVALRIPISPLAQDGVSPAAGTVSLHPAGLGLGGTGSLGGSFGSSGGMALLPALPRSGTSHGSSSSSSGGGKSRGAPLTGLSSPSSPLSATDATAAAEPQRNGRSKTRTARFASSVAALIPAHATTVDRELAQREEAQKHQLRAQYADALNRKLHESVRQKEAEAAAKVEAEAEAKRKQDGGCSIM